MQTFATSENLAGRRLPRPEFVFTAVESRLAASQSSVSQKILSFPPRHGMAWHGMAGHGRGQGGGKGGLWWVALASVL